MKGERFIMMGERYWKFKNKILYFKGNSLETTAKNLIEGILPKDYRIFKIDFTKSSESIYVTLQAISKIDFIYFRISSHKALVRKVHNYYTYDYTDIYALEHDLKLDLKLRRGKLISKFTEERYQTLREFQYLQEKRMTLHMRKTTFENIENMKVQRSGILVKNEGYNHGIISDSDFLTTIRNLILTGLVIGIPNEDDFCELVVSNTYNELGKFFKNLYDGKIWIGGISFLFEDLIDTTLTAKQKYLSEPTKITKVIPKSTTPKAPVIQHNPEQVATEEWYQILQDFQQLQGQDSHFIMSTKVFNLILKSANVSNKKVYIKNKNEIQGVINDDVYFAELAHLIQTKVIIGIPENEAFTRLLPNRHFQRDSKRLVKLLDSRSDSRDIYYKETQNSMTKEVSLPKYATRMWHFQNQRLTASDFTDLCEKIIINILPDELELKNFQCRKGKLIIATFSRKEEPTHLNSILISSKIVDMSFVNFARLSTKDFRDTKSLEGALESTLYNTLKNESLFKPVEKETIQLLKKIEDLNSNNQTIGILNEEAIFHKKYIPQPFKLEIQDINTHETLSEITDTAIYSAVNEAVLRNMVTLTRINTQPTYSIIELSEGSISLLTQMKKNHSFLQGKWRFKDKCYTTEEFTHICRESVEKTIPNNLILEDFQQINKRILIATISLKNTSSYFRNLIFYTKPNKYKHIDENACHINSLDDVVELESQLTSLFRKIKADSDFFQTKEDAEIQMINDSTRMSKQMQLNLHFKKIQINQS